MLINNKEEPLLKPIYNDSIRNLDEIRSILWVYQNNKQINDTELRTISRMLFIIIEDQDAVIKNYLKISKDRFQLKIKNIFDKFLQNYKDEQSVNKENDQLIQFLEDRNYDVQLEELVNFRQKNQEQNTSIAQGSCHKLITSLQEDVFPSLKKEIEFIFVQMIPVQIKKSYKEICEQLIKDLIMITLSNLSDKFSFMKITNNEVAEGFRKIEYELGNLFQNNDVSPQIKVDIYDKFTENVELVFRGQLFNSFLSLRSNLVKMIEDMKKQSGQIQVNLNENEFETFKKNLITVSNDFKNRLFCSAANILIELKPFLGQQDKYLKSDTMFISLMHGQFIEFVKSISQLLLVRGNKLSMELVNQINSFMCNKSNQGPQLNFLNQMIDIKLSPESSNYFLLVNIFMNQLEKSLLFKFFDILLNLFEKSYSNKELNSLKVNLQKNEIPGIVSNIQKHNSKNLVNYIEFYSEKIRNILNPYFKLQKWTNKNEPIDLSPEIEQLVPVIEKFLYETNQLFPDQKRGINHKNGFLQNSQALEQDMERMLAKKAQHLDKSYKNRNQLVLSILKSLFKGVIQRVRAINFNKFGLWVIYGIKKFGSYFKVVESIRYELFRYYFQLTYNEMYQYYLK